MEYNIVEREEFVVFGMPTQVTLKDPDCKSKIMDLWNRFIPRSEEIKHRKDARFYGLCNPSQGNSKDNCSFETLAEVEVTTPENVPHDMTAQTVPASRFFVVTHEGKVDSLGETYSKVEAEMKKQDMKEDRSKIFFELYDERFREGSEESAFKVYTPLEE